MNKPMSDENKVLYNEMLDLLSKSELAARNGQWMTCGTWAKNAMDRAYEIANVELSDAEPPKTL